MIRPGFPLYLLCAGVFSLLLSMVSFPVSAQEVSYRRGTTQLEDILPPSPEAASRVKYADVPFTHSTGAAEYSVPIYELKGLFIIDPDGNVIQLQGDGVEISYDFVTVDGKLEKVFTILGPDGTVYTFANHEKATRKDQYREPTYSSGQQVDWSAMTAWYLTQMTSRDGKESATFTYADGGTWDRSTISLAQVLTASPSANTSGFEENVSYDYNTVKSEHETTVLTGISLSGFTASFQYSSVSSHSLHTVSSGTDADNYPQRLTSITVTNPSGVELVRAETATAAHNHDGRILLNGINVYRSGTLDDRWTFSYNTTTHTVSRYSQDWFGYFNGENGDWINPPPLVSGAGRTNLCPYLLSQLPNYVATLTYGAPYGIEARYMMLKEANHDGARTTWDYEAGTTGSTISVNGTTVPVNVGVRVSKIKVYNGNTLVRVRSFSYGSPSANTAVYPVQEMYIRTSARIVQTGGEIIPQTGTSWTFTLHETPVTDGLSLQSARLWYGSVTEEVSENDDTVGNKTVYTYNTSSICNASYNTLDRFPSNWESNQYIEMLYQSTGNIYQINQDGQLSFIRSDDSFLQPKSKYLAKIIQSGIESEAEYSLSLVGEKQDDPDVFIDSYDSMQIDISDLSLIGKTSTAFQGAAIGHFLNEVQHEGPFEQAHAESLKAEGKIYGELIGDSSITSRKDYGMNDFQNGYQSVIYEYNSNNRFVLKQGAQSRSRVSGWIGSIPINIIEVVSNGRLKSVKRK